MGIIILTSQSLNDQSVGCEGGKNLQKQSRRERERENRRKEILKASWAVFSSKDYDSATVDEIAEMAELSKGTLYLYFQNKAELFFSTFELGVENVFSIAQEAIKEKPDDPIEGIKEIMVRLLAFFENNTGFFKLLSSERAHFELKSDGGDNLKFKNRIRKIVIKGMKLIEEYIQHGIDIGVLKDIDAKDIAFVLMEVIRGFAFAIIHNIEELRPTGRLENVISILLDGIRKHNSV
ncbi:TetR family transcriptional regulator [Candidatus Poribacteria bacterium]|nr:TetR family transcriptional regulator [Candidatus Poribacteria bacterium]